MDRFDLVLMGAGAAGEAAANYAAEKGEACTDTPDVHVGPWRAYLGILLRREDPSAVAG